MANAEKTAVELEIPVPFGIIAAKVWSSHGDTVNSEGVERIIALHGWQDNCGTFDKLIPLINKRVVVVAVDFPGHGLSSHFPPGCSYTDLTYVMDIKRVVNYLKWDKFTLLGHSMGGYTSIFFASLFPHAVKKVISLDIVKPLTFKSEDLAMSTAKSIDVFIDTEDKLAILPTPTYKEEDLVERLIQGHAKLGIMTPEAASVLLRRGSKRDGNSEDFVFTRDPRLRAMLFTRLDPTTLYSYLEKLSCELLVVRARDGIILDIDEVTQKFVDLYSTVCKRFKCVTVDGYHHFHLITPENVAPVINEFLSEVAECDVDQAVQDGEMFNENSRIVKSTTATKECATNGSKPIDVDTLIG
ncbi:putative serine hydrolase [Halotydeus destructor]|nr:putative serine hydrolase [Halotydeus destructor]